MGFWRSLVRGITAFRQAYVASEEVAFETVEARRMRYRLFAAFYEKQHTAAVHRWAASSRRPAAYKHIPHLQSLYHREFTRAHLRRLLEYMKTPPRGNPYSDRPIPPCCPLFPLVEPILHQSSKRCACFAWGIEGGVFCASLTTDSAGLLERVDPTCDVTFDEVGNVKGYIIEETRQDPTGTREVEYRLEVTRDGQSVVYRTFLNNTPYGWYGQPSEWAEPYGFVPLVHVKHNDVGLEFGWSEFYPIRPKVQELDEQASSCPTTCSSTTIPFG